MKQKLDEGKDFLGNHITLKIDIEIILKKISLTNGAEQTFQLSSFKTFNILRIYFYEFYKMTELIFGKE